MTNPGAGELPEGGDGVEYTRRDVYGDASEYGGVAGIIQPYPHETTPAEDRMRLMRTDPARLPDETILPPTQKLR